MKLNKKVVFAVSAVSLSVASAAFGATDSSFNNPNPSAAPGFFVGGDIGLARANYGSKFSDVVKQQPSYSIKEGGFTAGLNAGYHFNQYFDALLAYMYIPTNKYSFNTGAINDTLKFKTQAVAAMGRAYLPLSLVNESLSHVSLYGEGGIAYVMSKVEGSSNYAPLNGSSTEKAWEPIYGAGVSYAINQSNALDLGWTQIYGHSSDSVTSLKSPRVNMVTLGYTYRFTNL